MGLDMQTLKGMLTRMEEGGWYPASHVSHGDGRTQQWTIVFARTDWPEVTGREEKK